MARRARPARAAARGAAIVEALVAIPFFILIFSGAVFLGHLYRDRLRANDEARAKAWENAMSGCEGGEEADGEADEVEGANVDLEDARDAPGTEILSESSHNSTVVAKGAARAIPVAGLQSKGVVVKTVVACNEKRRGAGVASIAKYLMGLFKPF